MHRLAEMAAEEQESGFGQLIAGMYAMGFAGVIGDALPENDVDADLLLEDFAGLVLNLRSETARVEHPWPVFTAAELERAAELELAPDPATFTDA